MSENVVNHTERMPEIPAAQPVAEESPNLFSFKMLGMMLFIVLSMYNNASWGATFIYIAFPTLLFFMSGSYNHIKKSSLWILVLWLLYFCSTLLSSYVTVGRDTASFVVFAASFILAVSMRFTRREIRFLILFYIFVAFTVVLNIDFQWLTRHYYQSWARRASFYIFGKFRDPNYVMAFVAPAFVLALISLYYVKSKAKLLFLWLFIGSSVIAFVAAGSRAAMLSVLSATVALIIFNPKLKLKNKVALILLTGVLVAVGYWLIMKFYNQYALERFFDSDGSGRLDIWSSAMTVFREHWLFGGGMNSGSVASLQAESYSTHSVFVDILCDVGIVGMTVFVILLVQNCLICKKENLGFLIPIAVAFIVPLFFINGFNTTTFYLPLILMSIFSDHCRKHPFATIYQAPPAPAGVAAEGLEQAPAQGE